MKIKYIAILVFLALVLVLLIPTCNKYANSIKLFTKQKQTALDSSITSTKNTIELLEAKNKLLLLSIDSLKHIKVKFKTSYATLYDSIYIEVNDSCKIYLSALNKECLRLDSVNNKIITEQDSAIINYELTAFNYKELIDLKDTKIQATSDSVKCLSIEVKYYKKEVKKAKIKTALGFFAGGLIGYILPISK